MGTSDNAELAGVLAEADKLEATRKDAVTQLSALRTYAKAILATGRGSDAQKKQAAKLFPPKGRGASKK